MKPLGRGINKTGCGLTTVSPKGIPSVILLKTRQGNVPETRAWMEGLSQIGEEISVSLWTLPTMSELLEAQMKLGVLCDDREEKAASQQGRRISLKELVLLCWII